MTALRHAALLRRALSHNDRKRGDKLVIPRAVLLRPGRRIHRVSFIPAPAFVIFQLELKKKDI